MFGRGMIDTPWRGPRRNSLLGEALTLKTVGPDEQVLLGRAHLGQRQLLGQVEPPCPPGQFRPAPGQPCRGAVGANPGGGAFPTVPGAPPGQGQAPGAPGTPAAPSGPTCSVKPGYGPGGAPVVACSSGGGYNLFDLRSGALVMSNVSSACLSQWGNVTMAAPGDSRCGGTPPGQSGTCQDVPTDRPVVLCPPGNGVTVPYLIDSSTGNLIKSGIPADCQLPPNVRRASAGDPYCSGGQVKGNGTTLPDLIACALPGGGYEVRDAKTFAMVAPKVSETQLSTDFGNRRVLTTRNCSAIPGAQGGGAAAAGAPPAPAPPVTGTPGAAATAPGSVQAGNAGQPGAAQGGGTVPGTSIPLAPSSPGASGFLPTVPVQGGSIPSQPGAQPMPVTQNPVPPPVSRPLPYSVSQAIANWGREPQALAKALYQKYGPPDLASSEHLVWKEKGPWYLTVVQNDQVVHNWPVPHYDFLYQVIRYPIDPKYYGDLVKFNGSMILDRTLGFVGSMCGDEGMNFLAVNLAHDIAAGDLSVSEAQAAYIEAYNQYKAGGAPAYTQGIQFPMVQGYVGNPGEPA